MIFSCLVIKNPPAFQDLLNFLYADRLTDVIIHPCVQAGLSVSLHGISRGPDDDRLAIRGQVVTDPLCGLETVEFACGLPVHLAGLMTPNVSSKVDAFTLRAPLGVTAAITPFNFPVMVPMWILPIALAAGNAVILKPSSHTPSATQLQAELWKEAGLPDGILSIVYGGREAVAAIVEHPDIKAIQFVGSTAVGRYVYEEGTKRGKRVGAFTSAKNMMVVLPDTDLELAADAAVASGYGSAGERCMAQTLLVGVGGVIDKLRPMILDRIAKLKIDDGMEPGVDMGPIYTREHRASIIKWIDRGVAGIVGGSLTKPRK